MALDGPLASITAQYFDPAAAAKDQEWTDHAVEGYASTDDDATLLAKALASRSAVSVFGNTASFATLWAGDTATLADSYKGDDGGYDASSADMALAQHLAFWTGNNCERIQRLMMSSGLVRDKWQREDYLPRTILRACSLQVTHYSVKVAVDHAIADAHGAPKLRAGTDAQRDYANNVRSEKLAACGDDEALITKLCSASGANTTAKFWLDNKENTPAELGAMLTSITSAEAPTAVEGGSRIVSGRQYLSPTLQQDYFAGCCYITDLNRIFTPTGEMLGKEQFNAKFGGYVFQLDETGAKDTRKAFEAFTESQVVRFDKVASMCFRPELAPGTIITEEGRTLVNVYVPIEVAMVEGDATPFLTHLAKVLPVESDRAILLAYMAAIVQHKGVKFQWCPLLQGVEGNGKTLFTRCVAEAVGNRYTHMPPAQEISEKFNEWLFFKLFIGIEDVYVPEHKREIIEILKPMITNDRLAMRAMKASQVMGDNRANLMLNMNHKDGLRKTGNDRRFAVFFTAQQSADDLVRDGMGGDYFPMLYKWLRGGGYAIVAHYLTTYAIPDELNPAGACHRAPETSTTGEAIDASLGAIEHEIKVAIDEERIGFRRGWISSIALEELLREKGMARAVPQNKRRDMLKTLRYDWHPKLTKGRASKAITVDGRKPYLFILEGHISRGLKTPGAVTDSYEAAQQDTTSPSILNRMEVPLGPQS